MGLFNKYYSLKSILSKEADYNIIIGERSNGKTYASLKYALKNYVEGKGQFAYVRRWAEDVKGQRANNIFNSINVDGIPKKMTKGTFTNVNYSSSRFYLSNYDDKLKKMVNDKMPCGFTFSLSNMEHDKSTSFPNVTTIIFDEFLTRRFYIPNEFVLFMNTVSTIVRHRENVKIFMLGNTVNKFCPYFQEMGLTRVQKMEKGSIDVYQYGDSSLRVAVEYCGSNLIKKGSDKYFAFENPRLKMITGGEWEIDIYPHLPIKYDSKDILFTYFIVFNGNVLQCEVIFKNENIFTYIHAKTTPIKNSDNDIVFTLEHSEKPNYFTNILRPRNEMGRRILSFFQQNKVFYQDNSIGEIVRNYLVECGKL